MIHIVYNTYQNFMLLVLGEDLMEFASLGPVRPLHLVASVLVAFLLFAAPSAGSVDAVAAATGTSGGTCAVDDCGPKCSCGETGNAYCSDGYCEPPCEMRWIAEPIY